jgi:ribosomal protein L29
MTVRTVALDNLRALSRDELAAHLREQRGQLFQVRLQQTIGQVENHRQIRAIRQEIARTMTVQVEIRLAAERGEAQPAPRPVATPSRRGGRVSTPERPAAPVRPRRSRTAATAATAEPAAISPDAPVEEAISDLAVERIDAADDTAAPHIAPIDAAGDGDETDSSGAPADADEDTP